MEIGETLYVTTRSDWRNWLEKNSQRASEIWLVYPNKKSGKPRIAYDQAVEEALCFGWIDSIIKNLDVHHSVQRFSPRRKNSQLSQLNKVRVREMIRTGKMTPEGLRAIDHHMMYEDGVVKEHQPFVAPEDIMQKLKSDPLVWENYGRFPDNYKEVRIAYIDHARVRNDEFVKRLNYFIKMTRLNKMFGSLK